MRFETIESKLVRYFQERASELKGQKPAILFERAHDFAQDNAVHQVIALQVDVGQKTLDEAVANTADRYLGL